MIPRAMRILPETCSLLRVALRQYHNLVTQVCGAFVV
jgi:hypothetical protein